MYKKNLTRAMMASLGCSSLGSEKVANYSLDRSENLIEKLAGINIYQPTMENTEIFIRKYMLNELSFSPRVIDLSVDIIPSKFNPANKEYIEDATGVITLNMGKAKPEIPFMIRDSELYPFDIIQLNGERAPFTRDNLKKIVLGIDKKNNEAENVDNPFLKVEKVLNPSTSPGFLGDTLYIQDQHRGGGSRTQYVTASENIDTALEKLATAKQVTLDDIKKLEVIFEKKASDELEASAETLAKVDKLESSGKYIDDDLAQNINEFVKSRKVNLINSSDIDNASTIVIPQLIDNGLTASNGILFSKVKELNGNSASIARVVIKSDSTFKCLGKGENIICAKSVNKKFSLPRKAIDSLNEGDIFVVNHSDEISCPYRVAKVINRESSVDNKSMKIKGITITPFTDDNSDYTVNIFEPMATQDILFIDGIALLEMKLSEFAKRYSEKIVCSESDVYSLYCEKSSRKVIATDAKTEVIKLNGVMEGTFKNKSEFDMIEKMASVGPVSFEKLASAENQIKVECLDRRNKQYKVIVRYVDKENRIFKQVLRTFDRIDDMKLRGILRVLGFKPETIQEIIYKSRNDNYVQYPLPANADVSKLQGGMVKNISKENLKNTVGKFFNPNDLAGAIVTHAISNMIVDGIRNGGVNMPSVSDSLRAFRKVAAKQSAEFEKIAIAKKSQTALDVSKVSALTSMLCEKVASTIDGTAVYPAINDVARDIKSGKVFLEKLAADLIDLKVAQAIDRNEIVPNSYIQNAINTCDTIYKIAIAIDEANPMSK